MSTTSSSVRDELRRYQTRLREELWHAALVAAEDAQRELRELDDRISARLTEELDALRELRDLRDETVRIRREAEAVTARLAHKAQKASEEAVAHVKDFPVRIAEEVEQQVRDAFERQERGVMKRLAEKLNQHELEQCEAMSEIAQNMTTVMKSLVATMVREEVREEMKRVARITLPACVAAEVSRQLSTSRGSTSTSSPHSG